MSSPCSHQASSLRVSRLSGPAVRAARWPSRGSPACATTVPSCGRSGMTAQIRGGCHRSSLGAGTLSGSPCRGIDRSDEPSAYSRGGTAPARGRPRPGTPCSVTVEKPASRDVLNGRRNGLVSTGANVGFIRSPDRCVRRPPHRAAPVRHGKRIALTRPLQSHVTSTCPSAPRGRRCRASGGRPDRAHSPTTAGACVARRRVFSRDVPLRTGAPRRGRRRQCAESAVFSSHLLSTPRHM